MPAPETQTLIRAISILDCFSPDRSELGVREIARQVGFSRSTVGRLLATMHAAGILSQTPTTRTYVLGAKVLAWAGVYTATLDVRVKARPILEQLHRATRETVSLYVLDGCERVCVERLESPEGLRFVVRVGERMPPVRWRVRQGPPGVPPARAPQGDSQGDLSDPSDPEYSQRPPAKPVA